LISLFVLSDGTKITDSIFDSLKFSKQATKRSLRENIRESLEKMESVISVKLLRLGILGLGVRKKVNLQKKEIGLFPSNY
jgi:hypothetical protein